MQNISNINIIDPNNQKAGINNADKLFIYVDLIAESRGNTVFRTSGRIERNDSYDQVNLMGYKIGTKLFTTDYTEIYDKNGTTTTFEGFGIESINIVTNSSYVPTVTIKFIDIKGQSFFNKRTDSPYSVLTMFPPTLFRLKIKGFYGKTVEYKLHLLKYNTNFSADDGNYSITANFLGNTFAPLSDILFRYVIEAPYIGEDSKTKGLDKTENINTTLELISRSKTLNYYLSQFKENSDTIRKYTELKNKLEQLKSIINGKYIFSTDDLNLFNVNVIRFDTQLKNKFPLTSFTKDELKNIENEVYIIDKFPVNPTTRPDSNNLIKFFKKAIIGENNFELFLKNYPLRIEIKEIGFGAGTFYNILNLSDIFVYLINIYESDKVILCDYANEINNDIDEITTKTLGFTPTIKNVFRIMCDDIDILFKKIIKTYNDSIDYINTNEVRNSLINNNKTFINKNISFLYPFPDVIDENNKKAYPGNINNNFLLRQLPEVKFVEDFIASFINTRIRREQENVRAELDNNGSKKWIPNNVYDIPEQSFNASTPYIDIYNPKDIIYELINRYIIYTEYTYSKDIIFKRDIKTNIIGYSVQFEFSDNFLDFISKSEGINIVESLNNTKLIRSVLNDLEILANGGNYNTYFSEYIPRKENDIYFNENFKGIDIIGRNNNYGILNLSEDSNNTLITKLINNLNSKKLFLTSVNGFNEEFKIINENEYGLTIDKNNLLYFHDTNDNNKSYFIGENFFTEKTVVEEIDDTLEFSNLNEDILSIYISDQYNEDQKKILITLLLFGNNIDKLTNLSNFVGAISIPKFRLMQIAAIKLSSFSYQHVKDNVRYNSTRNLLDKILNVDLFYANLSNIDSDSLINYYNENIEEYYYGLKKILDRNDGKRISLINDNSDILNEINNNIGVKQIILINSIDFIKGGVNINKNILSENNYIQNNQTNISKFISILYQYIKNELANKADEKEKENNRIEVTNVDNLAKQEVYYSFKNFVDRWLTTSLNKKNKLNQDYGYSVIEDEDKDFIDYFSFIDRVGNNIGDENIIDIKVLAELENDFNINILSVFSKLLGDNGYEFFPLQNFINFTDDFNELFEIKTPADGVVSTPSFTCMYIGNTSSYANNENSSYYHDDGVDFTNPVKISKDLLSKPVNVFKVSFGENEQSIFNGIQLNTEEHQPTNESLKILSQIVDGTTNDANPLNISQNIFSVLEQRSYTCKIDMLGNALIQPTQFFQLENVPLFRGGYMILNVEHTIDSNNFMKTSFSGVRISVHEKPFVTTSVSKNNGNRYFTCDIDDGDIIPIKTSTSNVVNREDVDYDDETDTTTVNSSYKISKYLTYNDVIKTSVQLDNNIVSALNVGSNDILLNIKFLGKLYDQLYDLLDGNIRINSFYRSPQVNRAVNGAVNSIHQIGYAMDFEINDTSKTVVTSDGFSINSNRMLFDYIVQNKEIFDFDVLINEFPSLSGEPSWIHIEKRQGNNRGKILTIKKNA